jgi:hypothetical protein
VAVESLPRAAGHEAVAPQQIFSNKAPVRRSYPRRAQADGLPEQAQAQRLVAPSVWVPQPALLLVSPRGPVSALPELLRA